MFKECEKCLQRKEITFFPLEHIMTSVGSYEILAIQPCMVCIYGKDYRKIPYKDKKIIRSNFYKKYKNEKI